MPESSVARKEPKVETSCPAVLVPNRCWLILKGINKAERVVGIYKSDIVAKKTLEFLEGMVGLNNLSHCQLRKHCLEINRSEVILERWSEEIFDKYDSTCTAFIFLEEGIFDVN